tara:strand:- start:1946 stop:2833 length:888 start_codon:yes stop_codon:yes gene_type:complete
MKTTFILAIVSLVWLVHRRVFSAWRSLQAPVPTESLVTNGQTTTINGLSIHFREVGSGDPIVLTRWPFGSTSGWSALADELSKNYRVISVDLPGVGLSAKPIGVSYTPKMQGQHLASFIETMCPEGAQLVGGGMAWSACQEAAQYRPDHVLSLLAISPTLIPADFAKGTAFMERIISIITQSQIASKHLLFAGQLPSGPSTDATLRSWQSEIKTPGAQPALASMLLELSNHIQPSQVTLPSSTIIIGSRDKILANDELFRTLSIGDVHLLPHCAHFPEIEDPIQVAKLISATRYL